MMVDADETEIELDMLISGLRREFGLPAPQTKRGKKKSANAEDLADIARAFNLILQRLKLLEADNAELKRKLGQLESKKPELENKSTSFAAMLSKPGSAACAAVNRAVSSNAKIAANRANKVIIVGLPSHNNEQATASDLTVVKNVIAATKASVKIKSIARMKTAKRIEPTNPSQAQNNSRTTPVIVELESVEERNELLKAAKSLKDSPEFSHVFIRENRTPDEQASYNALVKEKNQANEELSRNGWLNSPFRFIILRDRMQCINVDQKDDQGRFKFANWKEAENARKKAKASATRSSADV